MHLREGRSHVGKPKPKTRERADVARPDPMSPPEDMVDALDLPEALHAAELLEILPQAARRDLLAGFGEVGL